MRTVRLERSTKVAFYFRVWNLQNVRNSSSSRLTRCGLSAASDALLQPQAVVFLKNNRKICYTFCVWAFPYSLIFPRRRYLVIRTHELNYFLKYSIPGLFFFFMSFKQLRVNVKLCPRLDSNRGPLESEVTTLPTEPLPHDF